ncbi:hypothetical protein DUNSADRAFT_16790 [Dunaliella salina]|uniref:Uncharacterized protein n=1 Tax=Dunaliella salina TaxID=3046 RepID=A0ABQ7H0N0_DUNSA|nr:hypothetical protein DUNSADRAFT_16790 [Dunaliella salina]|eukprot:KAF5840413.1 hypothetical protein DUNSADRAFT_16790 [Dunaliella salina]
MWSGNHIWCPVLSRRPCHLLISPCTSILSSVWIIIGSIYSLPAAADLYFLIPQYTALVSVGPRETVGA